jgi:hypothetical protein
LRNVEHYCTLFDSGFLPQGLCLYESLRRHAQPFKLWVLCMDERAERALRKLDLSDLHVIPLHEAEDARLLAVKPTRSRGEYCWTLTPFIYDAVFKRAPEASRVTYLDADLYFFADPAALLEEFEASGKDVLITEHAYAPEYEQSESSGRFCVQFLTFRATPGAERVRKWWQDRCLEWCFARIENGKFGDQKYLDAWPEMFAREIHILKKPQLTLAPWNARYFMQREHVTPVFYHFHSLRRVSRFWWMLCMTYDPGEAARTFYAEYCRAMSKALGQLGNSGIATTRPGLRDLAINYLKMIKYRWQKRATYSLIFAER